MLREQWVRWTYGSPKIGKHTLADFSFVSAKAGTTSLGEAHIICGVSHNIIVRRHDTNERCCDNVANEVLRNEDATLA